MTTVEASETLGQATPIVVIDDEDNIRNLLPRVLQREKYGGFTNVVAYPHNDGLIEKWQEKGMPGVVLTDVELPGQSGPVFVEKLFAACDEAGTPRPKVIFLSGGMPEALKAKMESIRQQSRDEQNVEIPFISKPYTPADVSAEVRKVLGMTTS